MRHRPLPLVAVALLVLPVFAGPALAQDSGEREFLLTNKSQLSVGEFYTSPATMLEWGDNIFEGFVLEPGTAGTVTISGAPEDCLFDMKFVFTTGVEFVDDAVDLCETTEYVLSSE